MTYNRLIGIAGVIAWILVGLPAFIYHAGAPSMNWGWVAAFVVFGAAFGAALQRPAIVFLLAESAAAIALVLFRCNGYEGTLLVVLAMQLGPRLSRRSGLIWIAAQTMFLTAAVAFRLNPRAAFLLAPPYLGFQLLAFFVFHIMAREMATRADLAASNAELRAFQPLLAESGRMAERLRIAQELHDALGHRLTVLTLNLEALAHSSAAADKDRVELCRSLTRELLTDVRHIVARSKALDGIPLGEELKTMADSVPRPRIHLNVARDLRIFDPEAAHVLLRCVQEITTNAARHSGAENLWIVVEQDGRGLRLRAHDDGRGAASAGDGFGIRGMRDRVESAGGQIQFSSEAGRGFGVTALLPLRTGAA